MRAILEIVLGLAAIVATCIALDVPAWIRVLASCLWGWSCGKRLARRG